MQTVPHARNAPLLRQMVLGLPLCALLLMAVFVPIPHSVQSVTLRAILDFTHFSLSAGACWYLWSRRGWPAWAAFALVVAAAALCEVIQGYTGRCPAMSDFLRGLFGATAALTYALAFRRPMPTVQWVGVSAVIVAVTAWPISELLWAAARLCVRITASV